MCELILLIFVFVVSSGLLVGESVSTCKCLDRIILLHNIGDFRIISSPNYPEPYCSGMNCNWHVVAPSNKFQIQFSADNLDLRKNMDDILFYDHSKPELLVNRTDNYRCTGDDLCHYTSHFQYLTIRFKTSNMEDIKNFGFQAVVTTRDLNGESNSHRSLLQLSFIINFFSIYLLKHI